MSDLASSTCEACRIDSPIVSDDEASVLIKEIGGWGLISDGVKKLKKEFSFSNYSDSIAFTNKLLLDMFDSQQNITHLKINNKKKSFLCIKDNAKGLLNFK